MNPKRDFHDAFAARPRPAPSNLVSPGVSQFESYPLRQTLAQQTSTSLAPRDLVTLQGNLWMCSPEAFQYFLPAFLAEALDNYDRLSGFAAELIGELTQPDRQDVVEALDHLEAGLRANPVPREWNLDALRSRQLEWFDSGAPTQTFHERFDELTREEGAAILAFLEAFQRAHGEDFPFNELERAIARHWIAYRED